MLSLTPLQEVTVQKHTRQFAQLWLSRRQKRVTPQLLQILNADPSRFLRERVVMALGRIEDPAALPALQALLVRVKALGPPQPFACDGIRFKDVPPYRVQLAIGRIKARSLKGIPKLNAIAREIGKTWPSVQGDAHRLRLKLQKRLGVYEVQESDQRFILDEFHDVLYRMGKRGENIRDLGGYNLLIWPQQKPFLDTAALSDQAEQRFWLNRALPPSKIGFRTAHLLDLGPQLPVMLTRYLKIALSKSQANPQLVARTSAYKCLFDLAVATNDRNFIPILRQFQKVNDREVKIYAIIAEKQLKRGEGVSRVEFPS